MPLAPKLYAEPPYAVPHDGGAGRAVSNGGAYPPLSSFCELASIVEGLFVRIPYSL